MEKSAIYNSITEFISQQFISVVSTRTTFAGSVDKILESRECVKVPYSMNKHTSLQMSLQDNHQNQMLQSFLSQEVLHPENKENTIKDCINFRAHAAFVSCHKVTKQILVQYK